MKNLLANSLGKNMTLKLKTVRGKSRMVAGKLSRIYPNMVLFSCEEKDIGNLCVTYSDLISERVQVTKWGSDL